MNNALYGKSIENVSLNRDINFVAAERRGKYLTSTKLSCYKGFYRKLSGIEMKKKSR